MLSLQLMVAPAPAPPPHNLLTVVAPIYPPAFNHPSQPPPSLPLSWNAVNTNYILSNGSGQFPIEWIQLNSNKFLIDAQIFRFLRII